MNGKMNNTSWCCNKIEELIKKYEKEMKETQSRDRYLTYYKIVNELKEILYE